MRIEIDGMVVLSLKEIVEDFDINQRTLRRYIKNGRLWGKKFGRTWYVPQESLKAFFDDLKDTQS